MFERHAAQSEADMRNVIFAINITVDGCCDHTKTIADGELLEHYTHLMSLPEKLQLKLVEFKILKSGCVALRYMKQLTEKN